MEKKYLLTVKACQIGYIVQAAVNNLLPLLFVYFNEVYNIPVYLISTIITYNFGLQIFVDFCVSKIVIKLGYKKTVISALSLVIVGLMLLGLVPYLFSDYLSIYIGIMIACTFTAVGGGTTELIFSPVVEALPLKNKQKRMSMLHSFYCFGHILTIVFATIFFVVFGIENWTILAFILAIVPLITIVLFSKSTIVPPEGDEAPVGRIRLFKNGAFLILFLLMICAGATEQAIAQWISYFAESGLNMVKAYGDLVGTLAFAVFMLLSRLYFGKTKKQVDIIKTIITFSVFLTLFLLISMLTNLKVLSLIILATCGIFVAYFWPSVYSYSSVVFPSGGTVMFSMLALGGDIGCTLGPTIVGLVADVTSVKVGILSSVVFSLAMILLCVIIKTKKERGKIKPLLPSILK